MISILTFGFDFQQNSIRYGEVEDGEEGEGEYAEGEGDEPFPDMVDGNLNFKIYEIFGRTAKCKRNVMYMISFWVKFQSKCDGCPNQSAVKISKFKFCPKQSAV